MRIEKNRCTQENLSEARTTNYNATNNHAPLTGTYSLKCQRCNKLGHSANTCRAPTSTQFNNAPQSMVCSYCNRAGHAIHNCFIRIQDTSREMKPASANNATITCNFCKSTSHWEGQCRQKHESNNLIQKENQVQYTSTNPLPKANILT